jgi:hypothetical protein
MHGNCRFARAALVVPYDNYTCVCHAIPDRTLESKQDEIEFGGESNLTDSRNLDKSRRNAVMI